jgi:cytochrome c556
MRQLVLLMIGIALGAACAAVAVNTLNRRSAYPRGFMEVMQHDFAVLRVNARAQHCDAASIGKDLSRLREFSTQIEAAMVEGETADAPFREYADRLRSAVDAAIQSAPPDCAALTTHLDAIGNACEACHRQYR